MRKNRSKRIPAVLLAASFALLSLTSCQQSGTAASSQKAADSGTASASFTGYPMNAQDTTLTWYVGAGMPLNTSYATAEESPFHSGLEKKLGVKINWQYPSTGANGEQAFNLMLASDNLPDILFYSIANDAQRYIDENVIRDLSSHIKEWSPSYYAYLQKNTVYDKAMKTDSGQYCGYGFFREDGGWNDTYEGLVIREDWLSALNLSAPKTISEMETVMRAFKKNYGAVFTSPSSRLPVQVSIGGAFGAYGTVSASYYIDQNKKIQLAQAQPEWQKYITKLHEWWQEGLIDQDLLTNDDTACQTKALNGLTGLAYTSMGHLSNWEKDAQKSGNGAKWVGIQYPTGDDGTLSAVKGGYGIGNVIAAITTSCPDSKLELAMRALDYAYTAEGSLYWNFGEEGVSWEYNSDHQVEYTDLVKNDKDGLNNAVSKYSGSVSNGPCIQLTRMLQLKNTATAIEANNTWYYPNKDAASKWTIPIGVTFTTEESNQLDEYQSAIATYVSEEASKFITGDEPLSNFNSFVSNLNNMGLPQVLKIYQAAYDRYLAR